MTTDEDKKCWKPGCEHTPTGLTNINGGNRFSCDSHGDVHVAWLKSMGEL